MSILQAIVATANSTKTPDPSTAGQFYFNGTLTSWADFSTTPYPGYHNQAFPSGGSDNVYDFNANSYITTPSLGSLPHIWINIWFYPTTYDSVLLSENDPNGGYYTSLLEIGSSGYMNAGSWPHDSAITSVGTVRLAQWNHVYFYSDGTKTHFELNGVASADVTTTREQPGNTYLNIGSTQPTHFVTGNRFAGYVCTNDFMVSGTAMGSSYNDTKLKFQVVPVMSLFADSYSGTGVAWPDSSGYNHGASLVNAPAYHSTTPKYFTFDKASTQYVQGPDVGNLSRWSVESWFRLSEPLSSAGVTSVITTTYDEYQGYHSGVINYTMSNYRDTGGVVGNYLTIGFYNGTWHTTEGFIPEVGRWYHVVGAYNGSSLTQWVDGEILSGINLSEYTSANGGAVRVGRRWDGPAEAQYYFPGDIAMAKIYSGAVLNDDVVAFYNATKDNYPNPSSLVFNQPQGDYLSVPASSDWNLGSTYTIEFWMQANYGSNDGVHIPGGQWGLINQGGWYYGMPDNNSILIGLAGGNLTIAQSNTADVQYAEPDIGGGVTGVFNVNSEGGWNGVGTPGSWTNLATTGGTGKGLTVSVNTGGNGYVNTITIVNPGHGYTSGDTITTVGGESVAYFIISTVTARKWTHVAVVNNAGDQRVYYDGVEQTITSGTHLANGWTNTTSDLYIGRLASGSAFDGKLALVRISNTARYTATFVPTTTYGSDLNTKLFLSLNNPLVDSKSHTVTNNGVSTSVNIPTFAAQSLQFIQSQTDYLDVAASSDWALSRTWTIEFWSKASKVSTEIDLLTVMCQDFTDGNSIQIIYQGGSFEIQGTNRIATEPTPNEWTHVALVNTVADGMTLYYNGVSQYTGGYWSLANNTNDIRIGARGTADFQRFDGNLALIRISNTAKYTGTFTPTNTYGVESDTKLFLGLNDPLVDSKSHSITNHGVATSTDFPA